MDLKSEKYIEMFDPVEVLDKFCTRIFSKEFADYCFVAHYGKGYDFIGILQWLERKGELRKSKLIHRGRKIIDLKTVYNIRLVDSLNLIVQTPLRYFPKTFGFDEQKGDFPHLFNKPENYDYIGKTPITNIMVLTERQKNKKTPLPNGMNQ